MGKSLNLRERPAADLRQEVESLRREQFNLRVRRATGKLEKTHLLKDNRRQVARLLTVIKEKEDAAKSS